MHPQVVVAARNPNVMPQLSNPRIRQVQMPAQRPLQRANSGGMVQSNGSRPQPRPSSTQASTPSKPPQRSQSSQENAPRPQQRAVITPSQNTSHHRAPLQQQGTPTSQYRSPSLPQSSRHPQVVIPTSARKPSSSQLQTPSKPQHAPIRALPAEIMVLMLSTADEYIAAARSLGSVAASTLKPADLDQYYKLMSRGLGCMETVLKKFNMAPRDEAMQRLRYASLLVEETDNNQEIEENLARGIALCNRNRLQDLKYAMQHLQARYQFQSNHRAALKMLDKYIAEAETFQHIVWVYAFRFLRVSLALQTAGRSEAASAIQHLHTIGKLAQRHGDRAIEVTCSALEAMIHLRSPALDRLEHAQRAIASARSHQLQLSDKELGQINILIDCIDVACSVQQGQLDEQKLTALQTKADQYAGAQYAGPRDGVFGVLLEKSFGGNMTFSTGGIFRKSGDGRDQLVLAWLPRDELIMLAYYLSGLISLPANKGNDYLQQGVHKLTQRMSQHPISCCGLALTSTGSLQQHSALHLSIPAAIAQRNWVKILDYHTKFILGLVACYHDDRATASRAVSMLRERIAEQPFSGLPPYTQMITYLSGSLDQSGGSIDSAMRTFSAAEFELPSAGGSDFKTDLAILATMNRLLVIRDPLHLDHYLAQVLFAQLQPLCENHPHLHIQCGFRIIQAINSPNETINRQKSLIESTAKRAMGLKPSNLQFVAIGLNYMASNFFADSVGDRPLKSVRAARHVSKQGRSVLWRAVSLGICINTFQRNGFLKDVQECTEHLNALKGKLPGGLGGEASVTDADADGDVDME
jgi:hypothetical protein